MRISGGQLDYDHYNQAAAYLFMRTKTKGTPVIEWHGCYDKSWAGFITKDSYGHPAKFSRGLIERIYDHMYLRGWLAAGSTVGDPFGGIACGGIIAAYRGHHWYGMELEPRFVNWGHANIAWHAYKLQQLGCPLPVLVQGDSRKFSLLWDDDAQAIITSPPYIDIAAGAGGLNHKPARKAGQQTGRARGASQSADQKYGRTPGQISRLPKGGLDAVATSRPFANCEPCQDKKFKINDGRKCRPQGQDGYGKTDGQIGNQEGETYWQAMRIVYAQCYAALRSGGVIGVVVKDYIKGGQRVRLCDDTLTLLTSLGFMPLERVHAMLVSETQHPDMFNGHDVQRKERKSFFKRLYESKPGAERVDWEEVLFCQKPL